MTLVNSIIRDDDVTLASYPRSGNTWVRFFLANLIFPNVEWNYLSLNYVMPDVYTEVPLSKTGTIPRVMKSHEQYLPRYKKAIFLHRDPRDVVISFYDYRVKVSKKQLTFEEFFEMFLVGEVIFGKWDEHVNSWLDADVEKITISYDDMYHTPHVAFEVIANFVGWKHSAEELALSINKSSFDKYKGTVKSFVDKFNLDTAFSGGVSGKTGEWRNKLTVEQNERIIGAFGDTMKRVDYLEK